MNFETASVKEINMSENLSGQQNIEADIVLPDYYNSIGKIIRCNIEPTTEAVNMSGDKISVSGAAKLTLIYMGEDKKLYSYENEYKYTKIFQAQFKDSGITALVKQNTFSLNYRALAPKRIEVRSVIQLSVRIYAIDECPVITAVDDADIVTKSEMIKSYSPVIAASRDFTVLGDFSSSDINEKIGLILRKNCRVKISEMKSIHNKIYIKGNCETEIVFLTQDESSVKNTVLTIPFSEVIDLFGIEENDICEFQNIVPYVTLNIKDAENKDSLEIRITVSMNMNVYRETDISVISDAYSLKNQIIKNTKNITFIESFEKLTKTESISFDTDYAENGVFNVCDTYVDNIKITSEKTENRIVSLITASFNTLVRETDGTISMISREHTFESVITDVGFDNFIYNQSVKVLSSSALQTANGKLLFNCDMFVEINTVKMRKETCFTDLDSMIADEAENGEKVILYFAQKGEDLWTIAKENKTSVARIKEVNHISSEQTTENAVLLLPTF